MSQNEKPIKETDEEIRENAVHTQKEIYLKNLKATLRRLAGEVDDAALNLEKNKQNEAYFLSLANNPELAEMMGKTAFTEKTALARAKISELEEKLAYLQKEKRAVEEDIYKLMTE